MPGPNPYACNVAIPLPEDDHIRHVLGDGYDPANALNVVKMFAGTDDMCSATLGLVRAVFAAEGVDPKLRQAIILRAATILDVPYEWQANVPMSLNNGLTQADIDAIGTLDAAVPEPYDLVCAATDELSQRGTLTDLTLQRLLDTHGDTGARKLVLMMAWFNLLSLFLNGCRVPLETTDKIGVKRSPLE
jgi:alkylhydroperoxidase family enzyme